MRGPAPVLPRHVRACQHSAEHLERWYVWTWNRSSPEQQCRVPYCCNSWRCETCRRHEAAVTFARFKQAVEGVQAQQAPGAPSGWVFLVATLDRDGYFSGKPWHDVTAAYKALGGMTRKLLERIGREWGPETREEIRTIRKGKRAGQTVVRHVPTLGNRWVSVVEAHRSGWPHVNLVFWCPELAALLRREQADRLEDPELADAVALARDAWKRGEPVPAHVRELARGATVARGRVRELLEASGWGRQSTAEAARDIEAVIGYGVKLAGLHDASVGELAKVTQCPMNAPERFRRLRSGKGFLPPRVSNPEVTGCLVRRRRAREGDWEIQAINAPKDDAQVEPIMRARAAELQLIDEEERMLSRRKGRLPAMPPLRMAFGGRLEGHRETSERRAAALRPRDGPVIILSDAEHDATVERARVDYARARAG